ncbi:hypothetical protein F2Q69_00010626 [Brassica cretica]|uniref:Uncharacterized protein n=1 Tax=Brassica cretica TaxID=69181 RepID=A0A8S9QZW4_BRACR|nr:hypothetical protein F2Q69_00010626 [Brassica cretica]
MDKLVRENGTGSFIKRFWKNLSLSCPRVEIIGTRDWKSGVLAKDLLDQTMYLGAVMLAKAYWIVDDGSMTWDDPSMETESLQDVTICHRMYCPDVCGNRRVAKTTQEVHYCGFPIAMKAWMGTSESLPSHMSLPFWNCEPGRTESPKGKMYKGSSVGSGGRGLVRIRE